MKSNAEERKWFLQKMAEEAAEALRKNGFDAVCLVDRSELLPRISELLPAGSSVGFGGSRTLVECGVIDWLRAEKAGRGIELIDRDEPGISLEERGRRMKRALTADYFFSGVNGIGLDGSLVLIDGYGNRVAPVLYGPDHVILVSGANKITHDQDGALLRAKEYAAPLNSYRLKRNTPCTRTGHCHNCRSEERICNYTVVLNRDPYRGRIKVFLLGEELGL
ncbi:MAG TPA: lactate utilization protein [Bacillota bacterium]